jgi:hypothetical protein
VQALATCMLLHARAAGFQVRAAAAAAAAAAACHIGLAAARTLTAAAIPLFRLSCPGCMAAAAWRLTSEVMRRR